MKIGIFTAFDNLNKKAINACIDLGLDYEIVDILSPDWVENVRKSDADGFFCPSTLRNQECKTILDERYYFVSQIMHRPIYPNFLGLFIHENKRNMAAWLDYYNIPHTPTYVFVDKNQALEYVRQCQYPIVVKANVGAAASKVLIIKNKKEAERYVKKVFPTEKWILGRFNFGKWYWNKYKFFKIPDISNAQKNYVIIQDYQKIKWEWRILKIGDSYFGHQKLLKGEFASGSDRVGWVKPPRELLDLVRNICATGDFPCMDVDVFETVEGKYLVNELQASFGSYLDYQMSIDGVHGRYVWRDGDYHFEEGDFNTFGSNRLKLEHFVKLLQEK